MVAPSSQQPAPGPSTGMCDPNAPKVDQSSVHAREFGTIPFTFEDRRAIGEMLCVPPDRGVVASRPGPGGKRLYYLEGWKVIQEANRVFGFEGWSQAVLETTVRSIDEMGSGRFSVCVTALVRITLKNGATREDRGGGNSVGCLHKGEGIIAAEKEAITDGTKRALRNFGPHFGLALYDKEFLQYLSGQDKPTRMPAGFEMNPSGYGEKRPRTGADNLRNNDRGAKHGRHPS